MFAKACLSGLLALAASAAYADCRQDHVHLNGTWGQATFSVEVADDPDERAIGLMNRPSLARSAGMLFIFETERDVHFWMKNTLIPLDILYFDSAGELLNIARNAVPHDLTLLPSVGPAKYVLEIQGGLSDRLRIGQDTRIGHPSLNNSQNEPICLQ